MLFFLHFRIQLLAVWNQFMARNKKGLVTLRTIWQAILLSKSDALMYFSIVISSFGFYLLSFPFLPNFKFDFFFAFINIRYSLLQLELEVANWISYQSLVFYQLNHDFEWMALHQELNVRLKDMNNNFFSSNKTWE